jgi:DNA repair photolyase
VQVVTKSDLVCRDADLLSEMDSAVSITITTIRDDLTRMLEPEAPPTKRRLEAIRILRRKGVPVFARIDPIIPGINDSEIEDLVFAVCEAGAQHNFLHCRPLDSWKRICSAPSQAESLKAIFDKGNRVGGSRYMQREIRESLMLKVEKAALKNGVTFASCREGLAIQRGVLCDGSHLMGGRILSLKESEVSGPHDEMHQNQIRSEE